MSRTWMIHPLLAKQRRCLVDHARDDQVDYKDRRNTNDQSKSERLAMRIAVRKAKKTIKKEAITTWTIHPLLAKQRRCLVDHARDDRVDYKDYCNTNDQSKAERRAMRIAVRKAKKTIKKEAIT
ncbi:hypothetical protein F2Q68_00021367 [Brassica cretica]|uniref:Uncharacterized protein n=2 Tax=Brassica cretica TaxID=69181 RepID=A0A8S9FUU3_BRACR|nr:hypothetical protein F2Q68_00021367 [Brassica cretica]KAF3565690.1 hypothetical protein DY000_02016567 [Brassica cretica]